jgi:DNA-binding protein H-NS
VIESEIARDPFVRSRKDQAINEIANFEKQIKPVQEEINKQTVSPELLSQPSISQTNKGSASSARPAVPPEGVISTAPTVGKAPTPAKKQRTLGAIFGQ